MLILIGKNVSFMPDNQRTWVFTGPESTGKTTLSHYLGKKIEAPVLKEYAREYLKDIQLDYKLEDVLKIARKQFEMEEALFKDHSSIVLDTDLTVIYIWLKVVFNHEESWINEQMKHHKHKVYFLCKPDLVWEADPLRDISDSKARWDLFERYKSLLDELGATYYLVAGKNEERTQNIDRVLMKENLS